jgi:hypothetical protein
MTHEESKQLLAENHTFREELQVSILFIGNMSWSSRESRRPGLVEAHAARRREAPGLRAALREGLGERETSPLSLLGSDIDANAGIATLN